MLATKGSSSETLRITPTGIGGCSVPQCWSVMCQIALLSHGKYSCCGYTLFPPNLYRQAENETDTVMYCLAILFLFTESLCKITEELS